MSRLSQSAINVRLCNETRSAVRYNQYFNGSYSTPERTSRTGEKTAGSRDEYRGATTAARFGDPQASSRPCVRMRRLRPGLPGQDFAHRRRPRALAERDGHQQYSRSGRRGEACMRFCSIRRGASWAICCLQPRESRSSLTPIAARRKRFCATFDHYIIMDDVEVTNLSEEQTTLGLAGPKSRAVLNAAGIEVPEMQPLQIDRAQSATAIADAWSVRVVRGEERRRSPTRSGSRPRMSQDLERTGCGRGNAGW